MAADDITDRGLVGDLGSHTVLVDTVLPEENHKYLTEQLITYIGNKRALISQIDRAVNLIKNRLGKKKIRILDGFSGSGVVSRAFKRHASYLASVDIEDYAAAVGRCFLSNRSEFNMDQIADIVNDLNSKVDSIDLPMGFIEEMYSPKSETNITNDDRVFYTKRNARRLDNFRRMLDAVPPDLQPLMLGPLIGKASVHVNTSGVFKGFHKDRRTGVGRFGGTNADALKRILGEIWLEVPVLSNFECDVEVLQGDINTIAPHISNLDVVYLDPPYNQHPYGSNYFMLNLVANYKQPIKVSRTSGIPINWRRSDYNVRSRSRMRLQELLGSLDAKFIILSFNDEGFISTQEIHDMLSAFGKTVQMGIPYNTYRGCRNLRNRSAHVTEQLFLVEKS